MSTLQIQRMLARVADLNGVQPQTIKSLPDSGRDMTLPSDSRDPSYYVRTLKKMEQIQTAAKPRRDIFKFESVPLIKWHRVEWLESLEIHLQASGRAGAQTGWGKDRKQWKPHVGRADKPLMSSTRFLGW